MNGLLQGFVILALDMIKILIIGRYFFGILLRKPSNHWLCVICTLSLIIYAYLSIMDHLFLFYAYLLSLLLISALVFEGHFGRIILSTILTIALIGLLDFSSSSLLSSLLPNHIVLQPFLSNLMSSLLTLLICCIFAYFLYKKNIRISERVATGYYLLFLLLIVLNTLIIAFLQNAMNLNAQSLHDPLFYIAFIGSMISNYLQIFFVIYLISSRDMVRKQSELNAKYLEMQHRHYTAIRKGDLALRRFRHDMKSHFYVLYDLAEQRKPEEIAAYLKEIRWNTGLRDKPIQVHHPIVDIILNQYDQTARECGIELEVSGHLPAKCRIENFDLCTIFGNLLSNAFEAVKHLTDKRVELTLRYDETNIYIQQKNAYAGHISVHEEHMVTKKKDKRNHGLGIQNMMDSARKYDGVIDISTEHQMFQILILLNNENTV